VGLAPAAIVALGAAQLAAGTTVYRFATWSAMVNWAAYFALFAVALDAASGRFRQSLLCAGFAIAVLATVQSFTSGGAIYWIFPTRAGRPFGPFANPDHYAAFIELILPLAIYEAQRDSRRRWLYTAMTGVLYGSVIASASRAGAVLATVELLALPLLARKTALGAKIVGMSALFAALTTAVVGWDLLKMRLQDNDPFRYRREINVSSLRMIKRRPWTGFGLGTYSIVYPEFATFDVGLMVDHAHNDWAEWTAEGGIPMLLVVAALALASLRPAIRSRWALGIHAVFLHSLVDFPLQIPAIAFLLFTLLGALYRTQRNTDESFGSSAFICVHPRPIRRIS
jgi:O-antigen ligase